MSVGSQIRRNESQIRRDGCEAILQPCNAQCNGARPIYTTARGFCNGARQNCTGTAFFRRPADNKIRNVAFVSVINF